MRWLFLALALLLSAPAEALILDSGNGQGNTSAPDRPCSSRTRTPRSPTSRSFGPIHVTMIALGLSRGAVTSWTTMGTTINGYLWGPTGGMRWGTNRVASTSFIGTWSFYTNSDG